MTAVAVLIGLALGALNGRAPTFPLALKLLVGVASAVALVLAARGLWSEHTSTWAAGMTAFAVANLAAALSTVHRTSTRP